MLVAAVLRPEQREDCELEVVRLALQQLEDPVVLAVREAEPAVEWLFRDEAQGAQSSRGGRRWKKRTAALPGICLFHASRDPEEARPRACPTRNLVRTPP